MIKVQRNARKQHLQHLHNPVSHTKCLSPWRSITIKLISLHPYQPIAKHPHNKANEYKRHTYGISHILVRVTIRAQYMYVTTYLHHIQP